MSKGITAQIHSTEYVIIHNILTGVEWNSCEAYMRSCVDKNDYQTQVGEPGVFIQHLFRTYYCNFIHSSTQLASLGTVCVLLSHQSVIQPAIKDRP